MGFWKVRICQSVCLEVRLSEVAYCRKNHCDHVHEVVCGFQYTCLFRMSQLITVFQSFLPVIIPVALFQAVIRRSKSITSVLLQSAFQAESYWAGILKNALRIPMFIFLVFLDPSTSSLSSRMVWDASDFMLRFIQCNVFHDSRVADRLPPRLDFWIDRKIIWIPHHYVFSDCFSSFYLTTNFLQVGLIASIPASRLRLETASVAEVNITSSAFKISFSFPHELCFVHANLTFPCKMTSKQTCFTVLSVFLAFSSCSYLSATVPF